MSVDELIEDRYKEFKACPVCGGEYYNTHNGGFCIGDEYGKNSCGYWKEITLTKHRGEEYYIFIEYIPYEKGREQP